MNYITFDQAWSNDASSPTRQMQMPHSSLLIRRGVMTRHHRQMQMRHSSPLIKRGVMIHH